MLRPRRTGVPVARRSPPRAASTYSTVIETVEPVADSGASSSCAQAAAIAVVSISVAIAPPCTTSPIVASSDR